MSVVWEAVHALTLIAERDHAWDMGDAFFFFFLGPINGSQLTAIIS